MGHHLSMQLRSQNWAFGTSDSENCLAAKNKSLSKMPKLPPPLGVNSFFMNCIFFTSGFLMIPVCSWRNFFTWTSFWGSKIVLFLTAKTGISSSLGRAKIYSNGLHFHLHKWIKYHFTLKPSHFYNTNQKLLMRAFQWYFGEVWVQFWSPNNQISHPDPNVAASYSFCIIPKKNHHQFCHANAISIQLPHSWCGPSVCMV